jgi:hypothetical protein
MASTQTHVLSLSLSLSHTHTHTHTPTGGEKEEEPLRLFSLCPAGTDTASSALCPVPMTPRSLL